jgi:hypothetical protein
VEAEFGDEAVGVGRGCDAKRSEGGEERRGGESLSSLSFLSS